MIIWMTSSLMTFSLLLIMLFMIIKKSQHPMILMYLVMLFSLTTCLFISKWLTSYILSYLTFMVIIGGLMIIFMYLVSLTNKDKFTTKMNINEKMLLSTMMIMYLTMSIMPFKNNMSTIYNYKNESNLKITNLTFKPTHMINNLYINNSKTTLLCLILLLFILIMVIKMCSKQSMPLRQMKK